MAGLNLTHIYKVYPNGVKAVNDFNMQIEDKEFIVFVGPSGCGKSTTLRMIAGLEEISAGELTINNKVVNDIEPKDRDIAMVFQNYALYGHMTVFDNMAFNLTLAHIPVEVRDSSKGLAKDKNGKKLNFFQRLVAFIPVELRDESGNVVLDESGNIVYATKKGKDGNPVLDKDGKPVIKKRWLPFARTLLEQRNENCDILKKDGKIVYVVKMHKDGTPKLDKNGKPKFKTRWLTLDELFGPVIRDENGNIVYKTKKNKDGSVKRNKSGEIEYYRRKYKKYEIVEKVNYAAHILGITEYLKRKPAAMSGGQRQRVALGRAIVRNPKVFLLDEPLSNLDAKLRAATRAEISKLHNKLQTTFIYVTHDQVEAMTMGTRIVVMKSGFVQQIDTPKNLYNYPCNKFVAGFIGTPQMNFFNGKITADGKSAHVTFDDAAVEFDAPLEYFEKADKTYFDGTKTVTFGLRCEHISVNPEAYPCKAKCRVSFVEELGVDSQIYADFNTETEETVADSTTKVIIKAPAGTEYKMGQIIEISLDMSHAHLFDAETENTIAPRIPERQIFDCEAAGGKLKLLGAEFALPVAINLADGKYKAIVPTDAISAGESIKVKADSTEVIAGNSLQKLKVGNATLFVLSESEALTAVDVDLKLITFTDADGAVVAEPLNMVNSLSGRIGKHKVTPEEKTAGTGYKAESKVYEYTQQLPESITAKLESACGKNLFIDDFEYRFSPYDVEVCDHGIEAKVERIIDYGNEQFAECSVDDKLIRIAVEKGFSGSNLKFVPNLEKIAIYRVFDDVRLV